VYTFETKLSMHTQQGVCTPMSVYVCVRLPGVVRVYMLTSQAPIIQIHLNNVLKCVPKENE